MRPDIPYPISMITDLMAWRKVNWVNNASQTVESRDLEKFNAMDAGGQQGATPD